jgi:hypothetical protein
MTHYTTRMGARKRVYAYYKCPTVMAHGKGACPAKKPFISAPKIEDAVWEAVNAVNVQALRIDFLRLQFDHKADYLRRVITDRSSRVRLAEGLAKLDRKRSGYLDQQAEGLITMDELREKLAAIEDQREAIQGEMTAEKDAKQSLVELLSLRDTVLESAMNGFLAKVAAHDNPEERHALYRKLGVRVELDDDGSPTITGAFDLFSKEGALSRRRCTSSR